jgi:hypothetical protein
MRGFVVFISAFLTVPARTALAAAFCVVGVAVPPQCMYDDISTCNGASSPPNTYCSVNPEATLLYHGPGRYCAVQSDRLAQCLFSCFGECETAARGDAICVDRGEKPNPNNPYRYDKRRQE